jgi:hypothetical protein
VTAPYRRPCLCLTAQVLLHAKSVLPEDLLSFLYWQSLLTDVSPWFALTERRPGSTRRSLFRGTRRPTLQQLAVRSFYQTDDTALTAGVKGCIDNVKG